MNKMKITQGVLAAAIHINALEEDKESLSAIDPLVIPINNSKKKLKWTLLETLNTLCKNLEEVEDLENIDNIWGTDNISAKDHVRISSNINEVTGAIIIKNLPNNIIYKNFYTNKRISMGTVGIESRGYSFYSNSNPLLNKEEKLNIILADILDALSVFKHIKREENIVNFWYFLGVLDYLKSHSLTLLHALTFEERFGVYNFGDEDYQYLRSSLLGYTEVFVRFYYQYFLGLNFNDDIDIEEYTSIILKTINYIAKSGLNNYMIKQPELDSPLILLQAAISVCRHFPDTDVIFGIPSGGTEFAFLTRLLFEKLNSSKPRTDVLLLTISRYSMSKVSDKVTSEKALRQYIDSVKLFISGRKVLILDDNSNTGLTGKLLVNIMEKYSPKSIDYQVAEVDIYRSIIKHTKWTNKPKTVSSPNIYRSAVNIAPITYDDTKYKDFRQLRKLERLKIIQNYYQNKLMPQADYLTLTLNTHGKENIKICGIHNVVDLNTCLTENIRWIGIHLTYTRDEYEKKLLLSRDWIGFIRAHIAYEYFNEGDLPIPWAEYDSITELLAQTEYLHSDLNIVLLVAPKDGKEIVRLCDVLLPKNFNKKLYIQVQSVYDANLIKDIKLNLNESKYANVQLIQTIGMNLENTEELLQKANKDRNLDLLLLDSSQRGGTGVSTSLEKLTTYASMAKKPFFIAGGLSEENIEIFISSLKAKDIIPYGFDIESSVEVTEPVRSVTTTGAYIKIRKDSRKVKNLYKIISKLRKNTMLGNRFSQIYA